MSRRCLVVHPGALGDVLLGAPALAHLAALGFATTLAVTARLVALFAGSGLVAVVRDVEDLALHRLFVDPPGPGAIRGVAGYDAVVSWFGAGDPTFRASLARLGCPVVVARAIPPPGASRHVSQHLIDTLAPLGPPPSAWPDARLGVTGAARAAVATWLGGRGIEPAHVVVLQPGAGSVAKAWPGFAALASRLGQGGVPVVALAGPADGPAVEALVAAGALDEDRLARDWPLPRVAALLSLARAAVGNDSGPTHLAAAVGCPTVALFGPTDPATWAPLGRHVRVVAGRRGAAPWRDVDVDRVEAVLRRLLAEGETPDRGEPARPRARAAWR